MSFSIEGLQEAQAEANKLIAYNNRGGALEKGTRFATARLHRYRVSITHVDTGSLRGATRQSVRGLQGSVFVDGNARNSKSGVNVRRYAAIEEARGGSHAAAARTRKEAWPATQRASYALVRKELGFSGR